MSNMTPFEFRRRLRRNAMEGRGLRMTKEQVRALAVAMEEAEASSWRDDDTPQYEQTFGVRR